MADEISELDSLRQQMNITAKFAARLAGVLARHDPWARGEIGKVIEGLKSSNPERLSKEQVALAKAEAAQVGLIEAIYDEAATGATKP